MAGSLPCYARPMRMLRFSRWQGVLIVLSIIWIVIGGSSGFRHAYDRVDADFKLCVTAIKTAADLQVCRDKRNNALAVPRIVSAAVVALGPLLIIWLIVYGLVLLWRWIRRGSRTAPAAEPTIPRE
jgi:hypothetical protein